MCVIWGFSYGLYRPAAQTFVSHLSKPGTNKITFSVFRLSLNLGMSIGPMLGGYLATRSFVMLFLVNGLTNLSASLLLIVGLMHTSWFSYRSNTQKKVELSISILKKDPLLRLFMLGMVPISMVFFQHESTLAIFLHDDLNLPLSFYGFLFTLNTLLIVCFELPLNVATMHWSYRTNFILGSLLITLAFAALCFAQQQWFVIGVAIVWTLGEMILYPAASSFIADIAPIENRGNYMSLFSTCSNLGFLLGPWAGALIMGHYGASKLWIICGIWGALSIIIFQIIKHNNQYSDRFV